MKPWARGALARVLDVVRSRSHRVVHLVPTQGVGIGNILYILLAADRVGREGRLGLATRTPTLDPWLDVLPDLRELVIDPADLRFGDQRVHGLHQSFAAIGAEALQTFVEERVLSSGHFEAGDPDSEQVTVNVRRGDYYSVPHFRRLYGFNIVGYLREALTGAASQAPIRRIRVISDDRGWCQQNLGFLGDFGAVSWQQPDDGPVQNLRDLGNSGRLVLANSTFSYWGGYISATLTGHHDRVWAPSFHNRQWGDQVVGWQLDPRWSIVERVPQGWDEPGDQVADGAPAPASP